VKTIRIRPIELIGHCPARLSLNDGFQVAGMNLENPQGSRLCFLAFSHFPMTVWQLQSESRFFSHASCPGCISRLEEENRVVFLLGHSDKWSLCQVISEYLRLCRRVKEPDAAARLKAEAIQHQENHEFAAAEQKMQLALTELKRAVAKAEPPTT